MKQTKKLKCPFLGTMRQSGVIKPLFADCIEEKCKRYAVCQAEIIRAEAFIRGNHETRNS